MPLSRSPTTIDSVHRYPVVPYSSGEHVAQEYWRWLDRAWGPLVSVHVTELGVRIRLLGIDAVVLAMTGMGLYEICGGLLARAGGQFRFSCTADHAEAALLDFRPALPTWLYRLSHGPVHEWTMRRFGRHFTRTVRLHQQPESERPA